MKMPDLATTGSAIRVVRWLKQPGQPVRRGEPLLEVETDKSAMEVECPVDGRLRETHLAPGAEAAGGAPLAAIELDRPTVPSPVPAPFPAPAAAAAPTTPLDAPAPRSGGGGLFARNRAAKQGEPMARPPETGAESLSPAQRTAARRLQQSKQQAPHFYLQSSANAAGLLARRAAESPAPAWDAFFVRAVARALARFGRLAHRFADDRLVPAGTDAIGVAADIAGDLHVVAIGEPAAKTPGRISAEIRRAVEGLRAGDPALQRGAPTVMTVSNLGGSGVESFAAILNPPEAAILAVGAIRDVVVPRGTGVAVEPRVTLTLSVDHRVANGKYAADFLAAIVAELENPA